MKNEEQSDEEHARELEIASVEESGNGQICLLRGQRGHDFERSTGIATWLCIHSHQGQFASLSQLFISQLSSYFR